MSVQQDRPSQFAVCINNEGYPASLELRKLYEVLADPDSSAEGLVRVIDESGEDYLYPTEFFHPVEVPLEVQQVLRRAS